MGIPVEWQQELEQKQVLEQDLETTIAMQIALVQRMENTLTSKSQGKAFFAGQRKQVKKETDTQKGKERERWRKPAS